MRKVQSAVCELLFVTSPTFAQNESAVCTALLEDGVSNVVAYSSEYDFLTVIKDNYCSQSFASMSKNKQQGFEATIKAAQGPHAGRAVRDRPNPMRRPSPCAKRR